MLVLTHSHRLGRTWKPDNKLRLPLYSISYLFSRPICQLSLDVQSITGPSVDNPTLRTVSAERPLSLRIRFKLQDYLKKSDIKVAVQALEALVAFCVRQGISYTEDNMTSVQRKRAATWPFGENRVKYYTNGEEHHEERSNDAGPEAPALPKEDAIFEEAARTPSLSTA
ncbi:hypothetical protein MMC14_008302 [Varicellaria rhodocarpa]|nr:hypothetical protein [Varicellaria rhodocarpa]